MTNFIRGICVSLNVTVVLALTALFMVGLLAGGGATWCIRVRFHYECGIACGKVFVLNSLFN